MIDCMNLLFSCQNLFSHKSKALPAKSPPCQKSVKSMEELTSVQSDLLCVRSHLAFTLGQKMRMRHM